MARKKWLTAMLFVSSAGVFGQGLKLNNYEVEFDEGNDSWSLSKHYKLEQADSSNRELRLSPGNWKALPKYPNVRGYNGDILLKLKAPGPITEVGAGARMSNFADSVKRRIHVSYSLDGREFTTLDEKEFGGGTATLSGSGKLPANRGILWIRFGRSLDEKDSNGKFGYVVFQDIRVEVKGTYAKCESAELPKTRGVGLKTVFPTGVCWPWERTKSNADYAKMELWAFVEQTMITLKNNGYDTCWFLNLYLSQKDMPRLLKLAEKYGMRLLLNPYLLNVFYNGAGSLDNMEDMAEQSARLLADSPALLGYVLKDEPLLCDLEVTNHLYELMKKADPLHDSISCVMNRQTMTYLRESKLPVVCSDLYYFGSERSTQVPSTPSESQALLANQFANYGVAAELYGKHYWFFGQMFGDVWGRYWRKGDKIIVEPGSYLHWRMPTLAETRWQIWESLRSGSKGVLFYVLFPPIPLDVPPSQAKEPWQLKKIAYMDKLAKIAAGWKKQPLTEKIVERDAGEGMVDPGGKPTKQMLATAPVMKLIRKNETLLVQRRKADFPVFFPDDAKTDVSTFVSSDRWLGVIVNRDLDHKRTVSVLVPNNVTKVVNLETGKSLTLARKNADFQKFPLELEAGDGALLEAEFVKQPGMAFCRESFDQNSVHRLVVNKNAEIFHHGGLGADANRSLRMTGSPAEPVCVLLNLTNPKSAQRTFSANLNARKKDGTVFCKVNGRLTNAVVKAVSAGVEGEAANTMHLKNLAKGEVRKADKSTVILDKDFFRPAVVPVGTTALEFYLNDPKDYIEDITVWFIPE